MKTLIASTVLALTLAGCMVYTDPVAPVVAVGFYDPAYGYWTGYGWDINFYAYGHPGYGRPVYRGPRYVSHPVPAYHKR